MDWLIDLSRLWTKRDKVDSQAEEREIQRDKTAGELASKQPQVGLLPSCGGGGGER